ncbi:MAG: hypothetical protein QGG67_04980 [Gammaproteobacteria bacterium]|jgi:ACT domain-containing protein|nr:hypothetical protein [Gammaproteobacteria bacterium]MDP6095332.1 hypothetical protein [Gammaproteobacteria bacterium]|tara:strand:+ start:770 stop:1606 length:837 start_codon:yes stop_codon:yes gene_type:complete
MNKIIAALGFLTIASGAVGFGLYLDNQSNSVQLTEYSDYVEQLLSQVETNSLLRIEDEKLIEQLRSELNTTTSQLTAASNQLEVTQEQVSPDYQRLESEIRNRVSNELRRQEESRSEYGKQLDLIRQLSDLDPTELGALISLQGRYGGFLTSLDVSDERMEIIVGALNNMLAEQNQARMNLMAQAQSSSQDTNRRQLRRQLGALSSPEAQLESLSFALTDEELAIFSAFQDAQQAEAQALRAAGGRRGSDRNGVIFNPDFQSGSGRGRAIQRSQPTPR